MKKIILRFFSHFSGRRHGAAAPAAGDNPAAIQEGSENSGRRHLVQVLMGDLLRRHGIPPAWIDCQMMLVSSRTKGAGMSIRLVVQHWDERLMNYASALQQALLADINRFEPHAAHWLQGISWQLEVSGSCPYTTLPAPDFWLAPPAETLPNSTPEPEPEQQQPRPRAKRQVEPINTLALERLFAIRDRATPGAQADQGLVAPGYEKTQPAPL